ncbi:UxaA family hydrolase [Martelella radicis]|uniref:Bifunctional ADP-heptose synthase (Sugar kinase/adenylyltransferase) n=1 Tax=Martelella radicis TaxID=1397476 RepID=A0A7W6KLZ5_9HYPH|nr:UxaA family hydrolase [Martelella radicis]MBB4123753.1 bifunctional ADP-heptose synthase (sugar kinase/adenylyltransferase) [Martelella radicis]
MAPRCFRIHEADNVATMLDAAEAEVVSVTGAAADATLTLLEAVDLGHKVALSDIGAGVPVVKFGVAIGVASQPIARGAWVHLHNCESRFDARSGSLDLHTGATTDTKYE